MTTQNPAQQVADEIRSLQSRIGDMQGKVRFTKKRDAVEDLQSNVFGLSQRLASLRTRGYIFEKELENQAQSLAKSWTLLSSNLQSQINIQSTILQNSLRPIELQMQQLINASGNPATTHRLLVSIQPSLQVLEDKVSATEKTISGMYDQFANQLTQFTRHLDGLEFLVMQLGEATFQLRPTEGGINAIKAVWCKTGKEQKEDPEGVLYLTDQRILFEQKQEVTTKKVLFVATEKKKIQQLQIDCPAALVEKVETSKQGLLKNEDHIEIRFASGAPLEVTHFHIWQDGAIWQQLLNRVKSKDFDKDRVVAIGQAEMEKVKSVPSRCPGCGANINQVVLRGMDTIKCEYCGYIIRL
jgi:hypothetical protein